MTVLITGGAGRIGVHLARRFAQSGEDVVIYDLVRPLQQAGAILKDFSDKIKLIVPGDVTDTLKVLEVIKKNNVDRIVHFARVNFPMPSVVKVIITATTRILDLARILGIKRVVMAGTAMEFGTRLDLKPLSEDEQVKPMQGYSIAKYSAEMIGWNYAQNHGVDFVSIRFSSVYGPPNRVNSAPKPSTAVFRPVGVNELIRILLDGKPFEMEKGADYPRDYTYISDAAEGAYLASTVTPIGHRLYHIGSGISYTLRELADEAMKLIPGSKIRIGPGMFDDVPNIRSSIRGPLKIDRAKKDLNFQPKYTLSQGLQEHIKWLKRK